MEFLGGVCIGLIIGVVLGAYSIKRFNVPDTVINGKIKAKKHGRINLKALLNLKK